MKRGFKKELLEWVIYIVVAVGLALVIVNYVGRFTLVDGNSMQPTLQNRNILIVERISQNFRAVTPGDIVVMRIPELLDPHHTYAIKRVIATEGQHVQIVDGKVFVDDLALNETYVNNLPTLPGEGMYADYTVPTGCIYVLGDNRIPDKSKDSRIFGPVNIQRVIGRAWLRIFPFSRIGFIE